MPDINLSPRTKMLSIKIMSLPPTTTNIMLGKSANKTSPPPESHDITKYKWTNKDSAPVPVIA